MSDEQGVTNETIDGPWVHLCEHPACKNWGGFGFAIGKGPSKWFCFEHRPETWPPAKQS
ncbi:hypothetical protein [Ensifer adhaerens]|uniref:hypothetical protein n=1 Tax=Ensifer adhaerens TaxID=106592 RepID=UPI0018F83FC1|nr:hypothetical protein [Ensifer adhaerens]